ncbi:hypothetical protein ACOI1H_20210 [Loktanella sp. DJP18]|uniref:hypothetical protein n=1 Tax=Loktanella sp. DJP18 TaxID=3409788 RepID=UPI003BB65775
MMLAIVRTLDNHEFVGVYAAADLAEVRELVDEVATPSDCQYTQIEKGGFYATASSTTTGLEYAPTGDLLDMISDPETCEWSALDPHNESLGSQLDALLSTAAGRKMIADLYAGKANVSLAKPKAA